MSLSTPLPEDAEINLFDCVIVHLSFEKQLSYEKQITYQPDFNDLNDECDVLLNTTRENYYENMRKHLEEDEDFVGKSECVIENLKKFNTARYNFEKFVFTKSNAPEKFSMKKLTRDKALSEVMLKISLKIETAQKFCHPEKMFGEMFDELFGEDETETYDKEFDKEFDDEVKSLEDQQEDFCLLSENGLISNSSEYRSKINPHNIETENLSCNKIFRQKAGDYSTFLIQEFQEVLESPSRKTMRCVATTVRKDRKYSKQLMKVLAISQMGLSVKQKEDERNNIITFMNKLYSEIMKCDGEIRD